MQFLDKPVRIDEQTWKKDVEPLVSISCITYNHEKFISDAIEGFLMQETTFPVEINIHEDASTDNTADIIREYEKKYPNVLFNVIYQTENQYSKKDGSIRRIQHGRARGKYYATCEGDDYWIDPQKLQKQVEFLELNNQYNLVCGGYKSINIHTNEDKIIIKNRQKNFADDVSGFEFSLEEMKYQWLTKTLTCLLRTESLKVYTSVEYKYNRDIHLFYHVVKSSKAYYLRSVLGVYRIHEGGINSMINNELNYVVSYQAYKELYLKNNDEFTRIKSLMTTTNLFRFNVFNSNDFSFKENIQFIFHAIKLIREIKDVVLIVKVLTPERLKGRLRASIA